MLKPNERIDDLQRNNYRIIQDPERFCFGMDAVLLSGFAKAKEGDHVIDLGTGTGIIPILMEAKTKASNRAGNSAGKRRYGTTECGAESSGKENPDCDGRYQGSFFYLWSSDV